MTIRVTQLDNGARVVTEAMPDAASVTVGWFVGVGARDEPEPIAGASHFLEHLLFKGTLDGNGNGSAARSAAEIAEAVEGAGGDINAYTTAEYTSFHTRLPATRLDLGLDLLADVVLCPAFRADDVEAERQVILDELAMDADAPDDRVLVMLGEALFPGHPLGREVLGTEASIAAIGRDDLATFHRRWYRPANLVVAASGALDHDDVLAHVRRRLDHLDGGERPARSAPDRLPERLHVARQTTEQAHLAVGVRARSEDDDERLALAVANQVLGGGNASRLFQHIREQLGLAYSVYSYVESFSDAGALVVHAGTAPKRAGEVLGLVTGELDQLAKDGVTDHELEVAVGYLTGSLVLGLEDSGGRMERIGRSLLTRGNVPPVQQVVDGIAAVTAADVAKVLDRIVVLDQRATAVIGPVDHKAITASLT